MGEEGGGGVGWGGGKGAWSSCLRRPPPAGCRIFSIAIQATPPIPNDSMELLDRVCVDRRRGNGVLRGGPRERGGLVKATARRRARKPPFPIFSNANQPPPSTPRGRGRYERAIGARRTPGNAQPPPPLPQEEYYLEQNVRTAIDIDEYTPGAPLTSMVDDVFFIVQKCGRRALATGNVQCACAVLGAGNGLLGTDVTAALDAKWKVSAAQGAAI